MPEVKEQAKDPIAEMAEEAFDELKRGGQPAGQAEKEKKGMLPTKKTPPKVALSDQTIVIYGRPKIGKSSFCANAPGALFLATEAGLNWLEVFQAPIKTWREFLITCKEISEGNHGFKTIVVDTVVERHRQASQGVAAGGSGGAAARRKAAAANRRVAKSGGFLLIYPNARGIRGWFEA